MKKLSDLLPQAINRAGISREVQASQVCTSFSKALAKMNPACSAKAKPLHLKNKTLTIEVAGSPYASEIQMMQQQIVKQINDEFGKELVERISYKITR